MSCSPREGLNIHAITSVGQSVRSEKNLSEISKNSVRFFLGAVFYEDFIRRQLNCLAMLESGNISLTTMVK